MSEAIAHLTFGEYLDGEARSPRRHELVGGRLFAIAYAAIPGLRLLLLAGH